MQCKGIYKNSKTNKTLKFLFGKPLGDMANSLANYKQLCNSGQNPCQAYVSMSIFLGFLCTKQIHCPECFVKLWPHNKRLASRRYTQQWPMAVGSLFYRFHCDPAQPGVIFRKNRLVNKTQISSSSQKQSKHIRHK